jgi:hypothetical protein
MATPSQHCHSDQGILKIAQLPNGVSLIIIFADSAGCTFMGYPSKISDYNDSQLASDQATFLDIFSFPGMINFTLPLPATLRRRPHIGGPYTSWACAALLNFSINGLISIGYDLLGGNEGLWVIAVQSKRNIQMHLSHAASQSGSATEQNGTPGEQPSVLSTHRGALPCFIFVFFLIKLLSSSAQPTPSQTLIYHTSRSNSRSKILIPDLTALITRNSQDPVCGGTYGNIYRCIYHGLEGDVDVRAGVAVFFAVY